MREIYDFNREGRIYEMSKENDKIVVLYKKFTNNMLENVNYERYLVIKTDLESEHINQWIPIHFKVDEERKSGPFDLYVYNAVKLKAKGESRIIISYSKEKEKALSRANLEVSDINKMKISSINTDDEKKVAYNCALRSVDDLYVDINSNQGFYAGLPWFFQIWTRDEAISLKSVIMQGKFDIAKNIFLKRIKYVDNGRVPNRFPFSMLGTADGTGWIFRRVLDYFLELEKRKNPLEQYIGRRDIEFIRTQLKKSIDYHIKNYTTSYLIHNNADETWMDTSHKNDTREGYRIEIQALWLSMLRLMNKLDLILERKEQFSNLEDETKEFVRKEFFDGTILKDGKDDPTVRPNIFLAYYLYSDILTNKEWETVFDNSIPKLWLPWGGFTTIDKTSALYCPDYTGEDNRSYHRGDSWFFVNNIAAISMFSLNKDKYKEYIEKIVNASTKDILYNGVIGRPSEVSSASSQKAQGCGFQLWSAATYAEMMMVMFGN